MYELAARRVHSVDVLWQTFLKIEEATSTIVFLNDLCTPEELQHAISTGGDGGSGATNIWNVFEEYCNKTPLEVPVPELSEDSDIRATRPFVSDRLWSLFCVLRAVRLRFVILAGWSVDRRIYIDWREDKVINQLLVRALPLS